MEKKFPIRTCIGCRNKANKQDLIRIVKTSLGDIRLDLTGKHEGRGAYICPRLECLEKLIKQKKINKLLRAEIKSDFYKKLKDFIESGN